MLKNEPWSTWFLHGGIHTQHVCIPVGCLLTVSQHALRRGRCIPACTGQGCVYPSMHWTGGVCRGCLPWGVSAQGCVWQTPPRDQRQTPPCKQKDWQTGVKTLPCHNFVAGGNKVIFSGHVWGTRRGRNKILHWYLRNVHFFVRFTFMHAIFLEGRGWN